ncbi:MAG: transcription antitermination factor NusB [Planctomycetota bacterium]|nr:transcription antitermination factor NusB [Planctomycetota bacterium]
MASRRTRARETALQMLYQFDMNPDMPAETVREEVVERLEDEALSRFAWSLYVGVLDLKETLDASIEKVAANWSLRRMAPTDRNVLRIGAFELLRTETPPRVVIDEAIELARKFGSAQSPQFVNGILDRLIPAGRRTGAGRSPATPVVVPQATESPVQNSDEVPTPGPSQKPAPDASATVEAVEVHPVTPESVPQPASETLPTTIPAPLDESPTLSGE